MGACPSGHTCPSSCALLSTCVLPGAAGRCRPALGSALPPRNPASSRGEGVKPSSGALAAPRTKERGYHRTLFVLISLGDEGDHLEYTPQISGLFLE